MKIFLLTSNDIDLLIKTIESDPERANDSSSVFTDEELLAYHDAQRWYNYEIRKWIGNVTK